MLTNVMHKIQTVFLNQDAPQNLGWMNTLTGMSELDALVEIKNQLVKIDFFESANLKNKIENAATLLVLRVQQGVVSESLAGYYVDDAEVNLMYLSAFTGLHIKSDKPSGIATLIMPRNEFKRGSHYRANVDGEDKVILAGRVVTKQRDWIRIEVPV